jgi:hypothetical protein
MAVDLLVPANSNQIPLLRLFFLFTKQAMLMRRISISTIDILLTNSDHWF